MLLIVDHSVSFRRTLLGSVSLLSIVIADAAMQVFTHYLFICDSLAGDRQRGRLTCYGHKPWRGEIAVIENVFYIIMKVVLVSVLHLQVLTYLQAAE
jgi:hypothetical protein